MNASRLLVFGLVWCPVVLMAQRREDILSIQRDVAQLQDQVKQLQRSQDDQIAALKTLVQQSVEASNKVSSGLTTLQQNVTRELADQQGKMIAPVATLGTKVDQVSDDFRSVRENIAGLASRLGALDAKLADISSAVRTLAAPPPPPPAPATTSTPTVPGPPPGVSAESLYQNAFRDYSSGKDDLAMDEFTQYLKFFSQTENGPAAQYYIGAIYDRAKQYSDAVDAFDAVLERFPENPKTPDALYMKGVDLMKDGRRADASTEFKSFLKRYPNHDLAAKVQAQLRTMGPAAPGNRPPAARKKN
jgi:TolA-binding protein